MRVREGEKRARWLLSKPVESSRCLLCQQSRKSERITQNFALTFTSRFALHGLQVRLGRPSHLLLFPFDWAPASRVECEGVGRGDVSASSARNCFAAALLALPFTGNLCKAIQKITLVTHNPSRKADFSLEIIILIAISGN